MLLQRRNKPIVFGGPSLTTSRQLYPEAFEYLPPVCRGDLLRLLTADHPRPTWVLITDGVFGESLAVAPVECMELMEAGWTLLGASSMGALRAADCSTVGMLGIGRVFLGLKAGHYRSDADVAVLYGGEGNQELTVSIVHADHVARHLQKTYFLPDGRRRLMLRYLRSVPWYERYPYVVAECFAHYFKSSRLEASVAEMLGKPELNPKVSDAQLACDMLAQYYLGRYV